MKLSKDAEMFEYGFKFLIFLTVLLMFFLIIYNVSLNVKNHSRDAACTLSIQEHVSFVESQMAIKNHASSAIGPFSLFLSSEADPPPIKCDTRFIESKAKNSRDAENELLKEVYDGWKLFGYGKYLLYPTELNRQSFCHVLSVHEFKKNYDLNFFNASCYPSEYISTIDGNLIKTDYGAKTIIPKYDGNLSFEDYIHQKTLDDHILTWLYLPVFDIYAHTSLYYGGEYPGKVIDKGAFFKLATGTAVTVVSIWLPIKAIKLFTVPKTAITIARAASFTAGATYAITGAVDEPEMIEGTMYRYRTNFVNNLFSLNNSYSNFNDDFKPLYGVVYHQFHIINDDKFTKAWNAIPIVGKNAKSEIDRPFIFSSITVVPYTEEFMNSLGCEYMPFEFEN